MARIEPLPRSELAQHEPTFQLIEQNMGFVPSSFPTMARVPNLAEAFGALAGTIMNAGLIDRGLVQFIAHVSSAAAGCMYCQAHTAAHAGHLGVDTDKIDNVWTFETDDRFSAAERAALRLARDAAQVPNLATDTHFVDLAEHYNEAQVAQIVAVISLFGYLNRWNDTMATTLEPEPLEFARHHLEGHGWIPGKHAPPE